MPEPSKRVHPKLKDDDSNRQGYLLGQRANNYVRQLQLEHAMSQIQRGQAAKPLINKLLLPGKQHPDLTWPVFIGEKGEAIAIYTEGKLGRGAFGGVFIGVNLDTGEPRAVKIQFPKNALELTGIRDEESVLTTLNRFEDRLEIKDSALAVDFIENDYLKKIQGLSAAFINLKLLTEKDYRALVAERDPEKFANGLLAKIKQVYGEDFSKFKINFLANGGERFVESELEIDPAVFLKDMDMADFRIFMKHYTNNFIENLNEEIDNINEFIEIGSQDLAWGVNLVNFKEQNHSDLEKLDVAIKVLEKIDALHQFRSSSAPNGLVHRDIKSANIMWDSETQTPTIVDMGFTRPMNANNELVDAKLRGTPCAIAPEAIIACANEETPVYSAKTDMYAAGVLLLELYSDNEVEIPFQQEEGYEKGAYEQALEIRDSLNENPSYSGLPPVLKEAATDVLKQDVAEPLKSIYATIKKMIEVNPNQRATFSDAIQALKQVRATLTQEASIAAPAAQQAVPAAPAVSAPPPPLPLPAEQQEIKDLLDGAINQIRALVLAIQQEPEVHRAGSRKALLKQAPTPKIAAVNEAKLLLRQFVELRTQDVIKEKEFNNFISNFVANANLTGAHKQQLLAIQTDLLSAIKEPEKENRSDKSLK